MHNSTIKSSILGIALAASLGVSAHASEKLSFFTWAGYELPEFDKSFLAAHPEGVEATVFGEDDDAFAKVKAGFSPDIAHPCYDKISRWSKEGLIQPIDTRRIKNWDSIFPVFKNLPDIQAGDGKVWMVPWDWGNVSVLYRTDLIKNPEPCVDARHRSRHSRRRRNPRRRQSL
jgi:spermidine/putrescine transport system substrate-binding protein